MDAATMKDTTRTERNKMTDTAESLLRDIRSLLSETQSVKHRTSSVSQHIIARIDAELASKTSQNTPRTDKVDWDMGGFEQMRNLACQLERELAAAQINAAPQAKCTQELPGRGENIDLLNAPAGAAPAQETTCDHGECFGGKCIYAKATDAGEGLVERLRGYNTPDRTVDEQRQIAVDIHEAADTIAALRRQVAELMAENTALRDALRRISLGSQNSGTSKEDLGKEARAAIDAARKK